MDRLKGNGKVTEKILRLEKFNYFLLLITWNIQIFPTNDIYIHSNCLIVVLNYFLFFNEN